jgi:predicted nucleic acid-binding Zn ribbon protein
VTSRRRSPRPLSLALDAARVEWAPATLLGEVQAAWADVVGAVIAAEATPVSERGGVLTVSCSSSVWAQELDLMGPVILGRLGESIGVGRVTRIRCAALPFSEPR